MPEGPELRLNSHFVNRTCQGRVFTGGVVKSAVSKCCDVDFKSPRYAITSEARGKEMALVLQCLEEPKNKTRLLFRFGMSGRFRFTPALEIPNHAHLQFSTDEQPPNVLSFIDVRRFGSWHVMDGWGEERGPDPMYEYEDFRRNILDNLEHSNFNRPICEVMLNQKYFNGVGNYLRAEILFRVGIPPFTCARKALEPLKDEQSVRSSDGGSPPDLLQLCHDVPLEVVHLKDGITGEMKPAVEPVSKDHYRQFIEVWLRCYENPAMNNLRDHNGRTIWFKGEAGPMAPKIKKSRSAKRSRRVPAGLVALGEGSTINTVEEETTPVQAAVTSSYFSTPVHVKEEQSNNGADIEQKQSAKTRARKGRQQTRARKVRQQTESRKRKRATTAPAVVVKVEKEEQPPSKRRRVTGGVKEELKSREPKKTARITVQAREPEFLRRSARIKVQAATY